MKPSQYTHFLQVLDLAYSYHTKKNTRTWFAGMYFSQMRKVVTAGQISPGEGPVGGNSPSAMILGWWWHRRCTYKSRGSGLLTRSLFSWKILLCDYKCLKLPYERMNEKMCLVSDRFVMFFPPFLIQIGMEAFVHIGSKPLIKSHLVLLVIRFVMLLILFLSLFSFALFNLILFINFQ